MNRVLDLIGRDPGRAYLIGKGSIFVLMGVSWALFPSPARLLGIDWVPWLTPPIVTGLWLVAGVVAVIVGTLNARRALGFTAMLLCTGFLALVFGVASVLPWLPEQVRGALVGGDARNVSTAILYAGMWISALIVSQVKRPVEGSDRG